MSDSLTSPSWLLMGSQEAYYPFPHGSGKSQLQVVVPVRKWEHSSRLGYNKILDGKQKSFEFAGFLVIPYYSGNNVFNVTLNIL